MPSTQLLVTFFATAAIFAFMPGPSMLYAAAQTLARGRWSGLMASLGLHVGGYVHVLAAAFGLSVVFHAVPVLYLAMKLLGAVYLIWLGLMLMRARNIGAENVEAMRPRNGRSAFAQSAAIEILNPKTAIFYLAFLPQFVDPTAALPIWAQFILLGTIVNLMFSVGDLIAVALAGMVMSKLRRSSLARRITQRAGGAALVGLGAHLALQKS